MERKGRIIEAFTYLRDHGYIHTQRDLADAIGSTSPNISKMLNGDPKVLTDNICRRIQEKFNIISAEWLINGTGEMVITNSNNVATEQIPVPDYDSLINAAIAAKDETIASLKRELEMKDEIVQLLKQQLSEAREKLQGNYQFQMGLAEDDEESVVRKFKEKSAKFPSSNK